MFTVFIVGEHHDFPTAKNFIANNANEFVVCNLYDVHIEGMEPESIPHLKPHPDDHYHTLESYQNLYHACKKENISMHKTEDEQSRFKIDSGLHPSLFNHIREPVFIKSLQQSGGGILVTGAAHAAQLFFELTKIGANVIVLQSCPNNPEALKKFSEKIPSEHVLLLTTDMDIKKKLPTLLSEKILNFSKDVQTKMKANTEKSFPEERQSLEKFYDVLHSFSNLKNKEFQASYSALEYLIGSLYARENELSKAILYTEKSLERKIQHQLPESSIKISKDKLESLKSKQLQMH